MAAILLCCIASSIFILYLRVLGRGASMPCGREDRHWLVRPQRALGTSAGIVRGIQQNNLEVNDDVGQRRACAGNRIMPREEATI